MAGRIQTVDMKHPNRSDHVWVKYRDHFKCVLCGGVTKNHPPDYPTEKTSPHWMPDSYEPLTVEEKQLCPMQNSRG